MFWQGGDYLKVCVLRGDGCFVNVRKCTSGVKKAKVTPYTFVRKGVPVREDIYAEPAVYTYTGTYTYTYQHIHIHMYTYIYT